MISYKNTKDDFWASLDAGKNAIVCPCCGSHMSLQFSSSYQLMLTRDSSIHLNRQLGFYRSTLLAIERILKRHNLGMFTNNIDETPFPIDEHIISPKGELQNDSATHMRELLFKLDLERLDEIIEQWPKLKDGDEKLIKIKSQDILQLLQIPILAAGINTIAFDQQATEAILSKYDPVEFAKTIAKNGDSNRSDTNPVFMHLLAEFKYLLSYCQNIIKRNNDAIDDALLRSLAILILNFGHEAKTQEPSQEFTFGTYAQIRNWHSLGELLTSFYYVIALQNIFPEYSEYMKNIGEKQRKAIVYDFKLGGFDNVTKFNELKGEVPQFEEVVLYTVDFACSGKKATIPNDATILVRRNNEGVRKLIIEEIQGMVESKVCGWTPKDKPTESLLLVGGTASSKTTLLQSTIVQVKRAAANLGMIFETSSPLSSILYQYYEQRFDFGLWEGATESGDRTSIQISLRKDNDPNKVFYLVVNDIAGEHFEEMLLIEKDYNVIQSPLSYAKHIIFLFDLVAFRQLGALLQDAEDKGEWDNVIQAGERQQKCGRAVADSRDLLVKLVNRLMTASGEELPIKRSFILVIPKCDLYIKKGMFLNGWVSSLTRDGYLRRLGNGEDSPYMSTWNFSKNNLGGTQENSEDKFEAALDGINKMSDEAKNAIINLSKNKISDQNNIIAGERVAVNINSILTYLDKTFEDTKVVPVSALGKNPNKSDGQNKDTTENSKSDSNAADAFEAKAVPLFCEALFLLPLIQMEINTQK